MAIYLLVHGAFQGGWVWQRVAAGLRTQQHDVHTPTLSGCGHLYAMSRGSDELNVYIEQLVDYIEFEDLNNIILVAHSFSGMICAQLMMRIPHRIKKAIFVDAVIPEAGRSFAEMAGAGFQQMLERQRLEGSLVQPWPLAVFGVDGPRAEWFQKRLRPFSYAAFCTPFFGAFVPDTIDTTYISCKQTASPFIRDMALKAGTYKWPITEMSSGHCPMVTCPDDLARAFLTSGAASEKDPS